MRFSFRTRFFVVAGVAILSSCEQSPPPQPRPPSASRPSTSPVVAKHKGNLIAASDLRSDRIKFEFAIFYLPKPSQDPLAKLDALLRQKFSSIHHVNKLEGRESSPTLAATFETNRTNFSPPIDAPSLAHFGRGLKPGQAEALQKTEAVLVLDFAHSQTHVWDALRSAEQLTEALAKSTGGLIWDRTTRELFSPDVWQQARLDPWTAGIPEIQRHMTIHVYQPDQLARAVTLGMEKFGLPDVVIENFAWSDAPQMQTIINAFAQSIAEGVRPKQAGQFDLNIRAIKNAKFRDAVIQTLKSNAAPVAPLLLREGVADVGDSENRLIEISFERGTGPDLTAKQEQILAAAFGWEDSAKHIDHNEDVEAASHRARQKLPTLRVAFNKGLSPGELILVKAPFTTPGGETEWMWVEVVSWQADKIKGILRNEPENVPTLRAGQTVEVSEQQVFDYIRHRADGTSEGNETGKVIEGLSR